MNSTEAVAGPFRQRLLIDFLSAPHQGGPVRSFETGTKERVALPDLQTGRHMLAHLPIVEESTFASTYESIIPWTCAFEAASVFGPTGIVCVGDEVVTDTLADAGEDYATTEDGVRIRLSGVRRALPGPTISLLAPSSNNYYHWTVDALGRLAAAEQWMLDAAVHVLVPPLTSGFQHDGLALAGFGRQRIIEVAPGDRIDTAQLLLPVNMFGDWRTHPRLAAFFRRLRAVAKSVPGTTPALAYIDRRGSDNRRLVNEDEAISALVRLGFVPVRLEGMSLAGQIALFANARVIVGPHGAGLTNILFARSGSALVEMQMNTYVRWMFRVFAGIGGVDYDCVFGTQLADNDAMSRPVRWIDHQVWVVSITHMLGAVEQALARTG